MADADMPPIERPAPFAKERMAALSDGVFSVAMTLLVVDLVSAGRPALDHPDWWDEFWPHLTAYIYSFFIVGVYWVIHHNEMDMLRGATRGLLWLNLVFLLFITLLPFSAAILGLYWSLPGAGYWRGHLPFLIYTGNLLAAGVALQIFWSYVGWKRYLLVCPNRLPEIGNATFRNLLIPGAALVLLLVGLVVPVQYAQGMIALVPIAYVLWTLWRARQIARKRAAAAAG